TGGDGDEGEQQEGTHQGLLDRGADCRAELPQEESMVRVVGGAALLRACTAFAQSYPSKPIQLMIGYTAGGSAEAGARPLARTLEPMLGHAPRFVSPPR